MHPIFKDKMYSQPGRIGYTSPENPGAIENGILKGRLQNVRHDYLKPSGVEKHGAYGIYNPDAYVKGQIKNYKATHAPIEYTDTHPLPEYLHTGFESQRDYKPYPNFDFTVTTPGKPRAAVNKTSPVAPRQPTSSQPTPKQIWESTSSEPVTWDDVKGAASSWADNTKKAFNTAREKVSKYLPDFEVDKSVAKNVWEATKGVAQGVYHGVKSASPYLSSARDLVPSGALTSAGSYLGRGLVAAGKYAGKGMLAAGKGLYNHASMMTEGIEDDAADDLLYESPRQSQSVKGVEAQDSNVLKGYQNVIKNTESANKLSTPNIKTETNMPMGVSPNLNLFGLGVNLGADKSSSTKDFYEEEAKVASRRFNASATKQPKATNIVRSSGGGFADKPEPIPAISRKGEHHQPGYNYLGPGTRIDLKVNEFGTPRRGHEPINELDSFALKHDLDYTAIQNKYKASGGMNADKRMQEIHQADKGFVGNAWNSNVQPLGMGAAAAITGKKIGEANNVFNTVMFSGISKKSTEQNKARQQKQPVTIGGAGR